MRLLSYSINIDEFQDGKQTPILKYSGVYPSEALKTPQDLLQSIAEVLNEEFGMSLVVTSPEDLSQSIINLESVWEEAETQDLDTVKARKERIAKNKRELGFPE